MFAPVLALLALLPTVNPLTRWVALLFARYSSLLLLTFFILAAGGLALALASRFTDRVILRGRARAGLPGSSVASPRESPAPSASGASCWGSTVPLIRRPRRSGGPRSSASGGPGTNLWWADVRSWEPRSRVKRIFVLPGIDQIEAGRAMAGQPVRVAVRPGFLGLPWVASLALDRTPQLEPLLAAAPTAATPRRWLVESLLQQARWREAVEHTEIYGRYYPRDTGFVDQVVAALRAAGQNDAARRLRPGGSRR